MVYPLALLLVVMPIINVSLSMWPLRLGDAPWRFGAFGMLMEAIVFPLLGVTVTALGAYWLGHRRVLQALAGTLVALTAALVIALVLFGLDTVQVRSLVQPAGKLRFDVTVARAFGSAAFAALLLLSVARGSWKIARSSGGKSRTARAGEDALVRRRATQRAMPTS